MTIGGEYTKKELQDIIIALEEVESNNKGHRFYEEMYAKSVRKLKKELKNLVKK